MLPYLFCTKVHGTGAGLGSLVVTLAALLIHFVLNRGQIPDFLKSELSPSAGSLFVGAAWHSSVVSSSQGEYLVVYGQYSVGSRLLLGDTVGSDASDVILVLSLFE